MDSKSVACCLVAFVYVAGPAQAASSTDASRVHVEAGVEHYVWQEFDANGRRLLRERGPRLSLGVGMDDLGRASAGRIYALRGRLYLGQVNYDGQTQSGVPLASDTNYLGANQEASVGYRFGSGYGFDVLAAMGADEWRREIASSVASNGLATGRATEDYFVLYGKAGVGAYAVHGRWHQHLQVGVKRPLYSREYSQDFGVTLAPKAQTSWYGQWEVNYGLSGARRVGLRLYYDSLRFEPSNHQPATINGSAYEVWQPQSRMDVWGLEGAYYF